MHASVEILQIEKLIEGADDGTAKGRDLFLHLLDAEGFRRPQWI